MRSAQLKDTLAHRDPAATDRLFNVYSTYNKLANNGGYSIDMAAAKVAMRMTQTSSSRIARLDISRLPLSAVQDVNQWLFIKS